MRHLIKATETYRIANENEVKTFIEELKSDPNFEIAKYSSQKKEKKKGGEVIDEWIRFEVVKLFDDEKEPLNSVEVNYERT